MRKSFHICEEMRNCLVMFDRNDLAPYPFQISYSLFFVNINDKGLGQWIRIRIRNHHSGSESRIRIQECQNGPHKEDKLVS
jgi:hypothetical protein